MKGQLQQAFGMGLRSHRKARGLTQEAFGEVLGVSRSYVGALERGQKNLALQTVEGFADHLGLPALALLGWLASAPGDPDEEGKDQPPGEATEL